MRVGITGRFKVYIDGKFVGECPANHSTEVVCSLLASALDGVQINPFRYIAIGSGYTPPQRSNTTLETELVRFLCQEHGSATTEFNNDTYRAYMEFTAPSILSFFEVGLFDALVAGNMAGRGIFLDSSGLPDSKVANFGQLIQIAYLVQISPGSEL